MTQKIFLFAMMVAIVVALGGCAQAKYAIPVVGTGLAMKDASDQRRAVQLQQKMMAEPDLPEWQQAREKITLAMGDRTYDRPFDETFQAIIVGVATLEVTVGNMERDSGFISASGRILPSDLASAVRKQRLVDYAVAQGMSPAAAEPTEWMDPSTYASIMEEATTMTITAQEQGDDATKVKVRFNNIYYPRMLEESYRFVWNAIDKQGFLDDALDR